MVVATPDEGVAMGTRKRRSDRAGQGILHSPGRPGVARREDRRRFWAAIAAGLASEDAAGRAGVSRAVGTRWFREAGGMPPAALAPSSRPLSGRYLSFAEREEIALCRAQGQGYGRWPADWGGRPRQSRGSCAATLPRAVVAWIIGRRPRSGMPNGPPAARSERNW